jgi:hypothetical protein
MEVRPVSWILIPVLVACSAPELAPAGMDFVPGGVVVDGGIEAKGTSLSDGRTLIEQAWTSGEAVRIVGKSGTAEGVAPAAPVCLALFYLGLGDAPNSTLGFSADGTQVAVDNRYGRRLVDSWRGQPVEGLGPEGFVSTEAQVPQRCTGSIPVTTAIASPDGKRIAAVEGPIPEGSEVGYRLTVYR